MVPIRIAAANDLPDPKQNNMKTPLLRLVVSRTVVLLALAGITVPATIEAQEPAEWGEELVFHTFSIAAVDPVTRESGVAVTTRVPCVGNGVPWVRAGVGAVATQASTRTEYGQELLDFMEGGLSPKKRWTEPLRVTRTRHVGKSASWVWTGRLRSTQARSREPGQVTVQARTTQLRATYSWGLR